MKTVNQVYTPTTIVAPTPAMWAEIPWIDAIQDPGVGLTRWTDWMEPGDLTADAWVITQVTTGTFARAPLTTGMVVADSAGHSSAHDGVNVQEVGGTWMATAGKRLVFEARAKVSSLTHRYFLGLYDLQNAILTAGALVTASQNGLGFVRDSATASGKIEFVANKNNAVTRQAFDITAATWINLGFKVETKGGAVIVTPCVNGVWGTAITATNIPVDVALRESYSAKCGGTADDAELSVDWLRIFRDR